MQGSFFCLLCLQNKEDIKLFITQVDKLIQFDKEISKSYKIKSFFGEKINTNRVQFKQIIGDYINFFTIFFNSIKLKLYYINDQNNIQTYSFNDNKYTINEVTLYASLISDDGHKTILNKMISNITLSLDTFTPSNNVTVLVNKDYHFDNINV